MDGEREACLLSSTAIRTSSRRAKRAPTISRATSSTTRRARTSRTATFVAPSTGIHGWFWENKTDKDVTLKLVSAGFYDWIMQNRKDKQTALKPMDPYALPGHPKIPDEPFR